MDLLAIRHKANQLAIKHAVKIIPIYVFVELILLLVMMVSNEIVSILLSLFSVTITHAYVVLCLKAIDEEDFNTKEVALVGFKGYSRLFPSYFMRKLMINLVSILLVLPTILLIQAKTGFLLGDLMNWLQIIVVSGIEDLSALPSMVEYLTSPLVFISFIIASLVASIISYGLALIPYLVEKQDIAWNEAIMKSWKMMKGHKKELFTLRLSYFPQMLLIYIMISFLTGLLSFSLYISTFVGLVLSIYLPIIFYQPHLEMANALFYKELMNQEEHPDLFAL